MILAKIESFNLFPSANCRFLISSSDGKKKFFFFPEKKKSLLMPLSLHTHTHILARAHKRSINTESTKDVYSVKPRYISRANHNSTKRKRKVATIKFFLSREREKQSFFIFVVMASLYG